MQLLLPIELRRSDQEDKLEYPCVEFNDLPDEILLIILKKLKNIEVLYSLMGVNKRLDQIAHDYNFTNSLTLLEYCSYDHIYSLPDPILDRFCLQILSEIQHQIKWLNLDASSMERILLSGNYSNLSGLGIFNIEKDNVLHLVSGKIYSKFFQKSNQMKSQTINLSGINSII